MLTLFQGLSLVGCQTNSFVCLFADFYSQIMFLMNFNRIKEFLCSLWITVKWCVLWHHTMQQFFNSPCFYESWHFRKTSWHKLVSSCFIVSLQCVSLCCVVLCVPLVFALCSHLYTTSGCLSVCSQSSSSCLQSLSCFLFATQLSCI